ncbi:hypothetical protein FACS189425_10750 [Clostridia bacterium]|nr:hypothetical protein FACS189425_10750 [Clostridia bacterium]
MPSKKIAKALDAIIKGKPETPYDKIPSTYQHLTINYADGTTVKVEANTWCGILVGDRHFDCTAEEIEGLMNTLYS